MGRSFPKPSLQHALIAFRRAFIARAHLKLARCQSVIEGETLALEAGRLRGFRAVLAVGGYAGACETRVVRLYRAWAAHY